MQLLYNLTTLLSLIEPSTVEQQFTAVIKDICTVIANEQQLYTFVHASAKPTPDAFNGHAYLDGTFLLHTLDTPNPTAVISIDRLAPIKNYTELFHHSLLSVVELSQEKQADKQLLSALWQRLEENRSTRLLLLFNDAASEAYVMLILRYCADQSVINVIGLQPGMAVYEHSYWTLQIFPKQRIIRQTFATHYRDLYPRHMENMHGHVLRVIENAWYPVLYNFTPKHGPSKLSGYGGKALVEYARLHNATIESSIKIRDKEFLFLESCDLLDNKSADVGSPSPIQFRESRISYSSVYVFLDWCMMLPVEKPLPRYTFYYQIVDLCVIVIFCVSIISISFVLAVVSHWYNRQQNELCLEYVFSLSVLQRLLGAPYQAQQHISTVHKFISIIISLAGIIISNSYSTYLQTYTVTAPPASHMNTVDDILNNGIQIALGTVHIYWINKEKYHTDMLKNYTLFENFTDLLLLRNKLDTRYAFPVSDMWHIYEQQQKYFSKPLFRISNICFGKNVPMAYILQANSIYRPTINEFIAKVQEAGLIKFWYQHSFVELVAMGVIKLVDLNKKACFVPLKLADMLIVYYFMGVLIALCILCFLLEIFWLKIRKLSEVCFKLVLKGIKKLHFRACRR